MDRITSHGTVAVIDTGASEISGAVTLLNWPSCGQFSVAVVCTTGSSGVSTDSTKPTRPAMVATQRVIFTSWAASRALAARVCCHGVCLAAHGSALIGPLRLQPNTFSQPCSMTALGACAAGTTRM